jgi:glutamate-1-semialdehyde 2,1-aminomutase
MNYQQRLLKAIPGGAHTYSRGFDQFPSNAPQILDHGKGVYVYDLEGKKYLDYGMAVRAVNIGYAEQEIDDAVFSQIRKGNNLTRPSLVELQAAELLVSLIDSADMVKFTKNGSSAVSAAVKLARAFTGRDLIARCQQHPFFSYDDWFIGSTPVQKGIPQESISATKVFSYNDIKSLENLIAEFPGKIACVVLEPAVAECPNVSEFSNSCCGLSKCSRGYLSGDKNYLHKVQDLCHKNGIVFILDEMITGFRWNLKGAQNSFDIKPDLSTFGKAMANGYSVACVAGRREIMELGSIDHEGRERVFLLSTTHGAEMAGLGAFIATVNFIQKNGVIEHLWNYGNELQNMIRSKTTEHGISKSFKVGGPACSPWYQTYDENGDTSLGLRTLFSQEMIKNGVLMPWLALAFRHSPQDLSITEEAIDKSFFVYKKALVDGIDKYLVGPAIKPVFRKYN